VDQDADGTLDFLSGSYDPGDVYFFRGLGGGRYEAGRSLLDKAGLPLVHHPQEFARYQALRQPEGEDSDEATRARVASFGSWVASVDWDADGDLDLLLGSFLGRLYLRMNEGTRAAPVYAESAVPVRLGSEDFHVNGHADPVAVDWDGDGLWDLVVAASDGSVGFYRNIGRREAPAFAERRELVAPKAASIFYTQYVAPDEQPGPGVRAQICVTDYDGDGGLDLLLGDWSTVRQLRALTAEERTTFDGLVARLSRLDEQLEQAGEKDDTSALAAERTAVTKQLKDYESTSPDAAAPKGPLGPTSSFVWLFLRAPATGGTPSKGG